ncbi:MAG: TIGR01212 family radical SAM protein [Lachnospiraceae bacterium]|nr:TIGR01212 family radical SAM protein [Lachnospiraceae bacterium]
MHNYTSVNEYLKRTYGEKVYKLSLDAGMTCPNRDGCVGTGGCAFCSAGGSGDFACGREADPAGSKENACDTSARATRSFPVPTEPSAPGTEMGNAYHLRFRCSPEDIHAQIDRAKEQVSSKSDCRKFIAYFQAFTNTYAPIEYLRTIFSAAIDHPDVVILSVATRCDCLSDEVLQLLSELNRIKPVWVEMGMQSSHNETLADMNCCYTFEQFSDSARRLHDIGIKVIAHVILGLPKETEEMMLTSVKEACALPIDGIKLQLLHVLKGTRLAEIYEANPFPVFTMEEYCALIVKCLDLIPEHITVHRLTGDGPRNLLIAPTWSTDKKRVLNTLTHMLRT